MARPSQGVLEDVLKSMRETPISHASLTAALERAMQIGSTSAPESEAALAHGKRATPTYRKWNLAGIAASLLILCVAAAGLGLLSGNGQMARAELIRMLNSLDSVHLVIKTMSDGGDDDVEVWFKRGVGFAMHSPFGVELDNGKQSWRYYRSQNLAIRSKSLLGEKEFSDVQKLGEAMGFWVEEVPESLPRLSDADLTIQDDPCRAYVWNREDDGVPEELWPPRQRIVFLIDKENRLRRCDHQRGGEGRWKTDRTVDISYDENIAADRFAPDFGNDVRIVDANEQGREIDPEVAALVTGIEQRHAAYRHLKFTYDATIEIKPSPESQFPGALADIRPGELHTRDTLTILPPTEGQSNRPWRLWTQRVSAEKSAWRMHQFASFDGEQSRIFKHEKTGLVAPWEAWDTFSENQFDRFLFLSINGQASVDPAADDVRNLHLDRYHVIGRRKSDDREIVTLLGSSSPEFGVEYLVEMTDKPDFMILRWEARYARRKNELLVSYVVTEIGRVEKLSYPAKGHFRQVPVRELKDIKYSFEVIAAESQGEDVRQEWHPVWPKGTSVRDQVNDTSFVAP